MPAYDPGKLKEIFLEAIECPSEDRDRYLDRACGPDLELRAQVEALLRQNTGPGTTILPTELIPPPEHIAGGDTLGGRFTILRSLGHGGMGEVYAAKDLELGDVVALKTVRSSLAGDENIMSRFRREIQLSRQVTHPNVCRVFDLGRHVPADGGPAIAFLTMECLSGETLKDRLKAAGPVALSEATIIASQIALGLTALHEKGILHRDLKPANVMLTADGVRRAVIMDFGIARELTGDQGDLTQSGHVVGTPGYIAPEQMYRGTAVSVASDIYSLGVVLYEMVTGARFAAPPERGQSDLPLQWESAILHCLERDPAARPASAMEAVAPLVETGTGRVSGSSPALPPGTQIDVYRIVRRLGKGGIGEVYLAEDTSLGRQVALKVLPAEYVSDPRRRRIFEQDARAASRLNHPNSAAVYGFGQWSGGAYLALEYVEGEALDARLRRGPLDFDDIARYGAQLAEVIGAAHGAGLTQRDIRPGNIVLTGQGLVKLLDFGLAKFEAGHGENGGNPLLTAAQAGSVAYLSPEHALAKPLDARSDIFSLGAVLYEMATTRQPFQGTTGAEVISKILTSAPEPLARWNYEAPREIERIIRKCLEKKPEDRYQSARELAIDLRAWQRAGGTQTDPAVSAAARTAGKPQAGSTRRWMMASAGTAAVAATGLGVYYTWFDGHVPESIAIFPFAGVGENTQVLGDGLTESLIDQVASTGALRVMARSAVFRFKQLDDPIGAARKLNAAMLVTGKLTSNQDLVQISLEMVDVATSSQVWKYSSSAAVSGFQSVASQIAEQILRALGVRGRKPRADQPAKTADPEAYKLFLRGRHTLNRRLPEAFATASDLFNKAIEIDPLYARPYAGLADVYWIQSGDRPPNDVCPKSKAAALKAIELDPNLADAHAALGSVQVHYDLAWVDAEKSFQRAISLNPSYPQGHSNYARLLTARKRFLEAEEEQKKAIALDPLAVPALTSLGMTYYYARRFDEAAAVFKKALADQPGSIQARSFLGLTQIAQKNYRTAIESIEECLKRMGEDDIGLVSDLGLAYALAGNPAKAREMLPRVERVSAKYYSAPCFQAGLLLALGMRDQALTALEQSVDPDHSWPVMYYAVEPKLDPVRTEPRFLNLLRKTGAVL
jgi:serine/threonine protein kinase/tetratricopeptide (TPR) repeat protein